MKVVPKILLKAGVKVLMNVVLKGFLFMEIFKVYLVTLNLSGPKIS